MIKPFRGNFGLTQGFGLNPADYACFGLKGHNGLDYGLPTGTQVIAPHDGKVIEAQNDPSGYGNYIKIENTKGGSVLAHLQTFQVKVGDMVSEGQPIALSNNTGNSTGPHLHWGYYLFPRDRNNGFNGYIDQLPLLKPTTEPMATITQKDLNAIIEARNSNWDNLQTTKKENETLIKEFNRNIRILGRYREDFQTIIDIIEKLRNI